jgi:hypothetical protein
MNSNRKSMGETFQADLTVNLFIAFVAALAPLVARLPQPRADIVTPLRTASPTSGNAQALAATWQPTYTFYDIWLALGGKAYQIDMPAFARAMAAGHPLFSGEAFDDSSEPIAGDLDPAAFRFVFILRSGSVPEGLYRRVVALAPQQAQPDIPGSQGASEARAAGLPMLILASEESLATVLENIVTLRAINSNINIAVMESGPNKAIHVRMLRTPRIYALDNAYR